MTKEYMGSDGSMMRKMPCSITAERALLGSILFDPNAITEIAATITAEDFYVQEHKHIYLAMRELFDASKEIDPVTLIDALVQNGVYQKSGGDEYIRSLLDATPSAQNIADYARIVKDASIRRRIIEVCGEITDLTFEEQDGVPHVLDLAQSRFTEISQGRDSRNFRHIILRLINVHTLFRSFRHFLPQLFDFILI